MRVVWTRLAQSHLRAIHDYIALDSMLHAQKFVDQITQRSKLLQSMPYAGAEVPEYATETVRELLFRSYRLIYVVQAHQIDVVAVLHAARLLPNEPPRP